MSYQVLARKWRPRTFAQMVGQEHVVKALCNALDNDRLHHAFLFSGTRGVGKTSVARVLAKALNCERGVSSTPCGECAACEEVDAGRFVDLIEVDAASRTGVDDTRDLLDNVQYAPARGRYKVYLIDEVHMFSRSSFNALLKTLEEPPPHVKFLLATTDPRKLPATVLSRCLQFNLRRLSAGSIGRHLSFILDSEKIAHEATTLGLLARSADGSLRDALSLLDQAIAFCGGDLRTDAVREMLGTIDHDHVVGLLNCLVEQDAVALLRTIETIDRLAPDYEHLLGELLTLLQRVAIAQVAEQAEDDDVADPAVLRRFASAMSPEDVQLAYQIALIGKRDLPLSPDARSGFEMVMLRMLWFTPVPEEERDGRDPRSASQPGTAGKAANRQESAQAQQSVASETRVARVDSKSSASRSGLARQALDRALEPASQSENLPIGGERATDDRGDGGTNPPEVPVDGSERSEHAPPDAVGSSEMPETAAAKTHQPEAANDAGHEGPREAGREARAGVLPVEGGEIDLEQWHRIFEALQLDGVAGQLAANCVLERCESGRARLSLSAEHSHLCTAGAQARLDQALSDYFSAVVQSEVQTTEELADTPADRAARRRAERQRQAERAIAEDPNVKALMDTFGATILPSSVKPNTTPGQ